MPTEGFAAAKSEINKRDFVGTSSLSCHVYCSPKENFKHDNC